MADNQLQRIKIDALLAELERLRFVVAEQQRKIAALEEDKRQLVAGFQAVNQKMRLNGLFN